MRADPAAFAALIAHPDSRVLAIAGLDPMLDGERLRWERPQPGEHLLLGLEEGAGRFAALPPPTDAASQTGSPDWRILAELSPTDAAIWGCARSLLAWHARHRFCSVCGQASVPMKAGWARACTGCGSEHFPRVDPVVIMLVVHEDAVLLGRQSRFPPRRFSALAGFVEPGESLEEAVRREVFEEAGVPVAEVTYLASQPWPFPSSLMVACLARATATAIVIDERELDDARWFTRAQVASAMANAPDAAFVAPPPFAVAHTLLAHWLRAGPLAALGAND